jgi:hypothetical protein
MGLMDMIKKLFGGVAQPKDEVPAATVTPPPAPTPQQPPADDQPKAQ